MTSKDGSSRFRFVLPSGLDMEEQIIFCVGQLVAEWAVCESVLRGLFIALTGGTSSQAAAHAEVAWLSCSNSKQRRDLFVRSVQISEWAVAYKAEILLLLERFKTVSDARNSYAHAFYVGDADTIKLKEIQFVRLTLDEQVIKVTSKPANKATVNELTQAIQRCGDLNREIFGFLQAIQCHMKVQHPVLPPLPDGYPNNPRFPPPQKE